MAKRWKIRVRSHDGKNLDLKLKPVVHIVDEYPLYGGTPPHVRGSDTSTGAAESMRPHVTRLAQKVLKYLRWCKEATTDEIELELSMSHQTASARVRELVLKGEVEDSGKRRRTRSGRKATVWRPRCG